MHQPPSLTRRDFLARTALAVGAVGLAARSTAFAEDAAANRFKIIGFSKPFRTYSAEETADYVAEIGWEGIECPVRSKDGQIHPERVEEDLPKMVEALKKRGKEVTIITTEIQDASNPLTQKVLRTAQKLGIKRYRLGFWHYSKTRPIPEQVVEIGAQLRDLAALNKELGLKAGFQNHSGPDYVGAPIWDVWTMIKDLDPKCIGMCFDIGHATIEGGLCWPVQAQLILPHLTAVFVKDFIWEKGPKGWKTTWVPLGEGEVHKAFFDNLKKSSYNGPICQHQEYPLGDKAAMLASMQKDLATLKSWLAA